jgi:hypothetical protein
MVRDDLDAADLFAQACILDVLLENRRMLMAVWNNRDQLTWGPRQTEAFDRVLESLDALILLFSRAR